MAAAAVPELFEDVRCPTCPSGDSTFFREMLGHRFRRCASCGLAYMTPRPRPEALRALYTASYFNSGDPTCGYAVYREDRPALRDKAERLLPSVERHAGGVGRLLDVGCAWGFTLEVARERGWDVTGVEPAVEVAAAVARGLGATVHTNLFAANLPEGGFDAVTLWDVIEHVPDPRALLVELRRILRPGGICQVATPDLGSLAARVLGGRWEEMQKMPEHIFFFDRRSLTAILAAAGLEPLEWGTVGKRMTVEETVARLVPVAPPLGRVALALLRAAGAHRLVGYFDPRWKLVVTARSASRSSR